MPQLVLAKKDTPMVIGEGEHKFEVHHNWAQLPSRYSWQTTHNVALDKTGHLYVIHEGRANLKDHPSIFVFDSKGKFVRAFGNQFQGGGFMVLRFERKMARSTSSFAPTKTLSLFAKLTLKGETVWRSMAPMDSGVYRKDEDKVRVKRWGRDAFMPTNFAFLDDGGFLLANGYGSFCIHRYDKDGNWISHFGGQEKGEGKFSTHGIWIDRRDGRETNVAVCDRANHTIQFLNLDGQHLETIRGYGLPANMDTWKNLMLVPELHARVTLLNENNAVVARLGDDVESVIKRKKVSRNKPAALWNDGKFVHPHDACFGPNGDIYIAEWVATGRVTRLKRLSLIISSFNHF